MEPPPRGQVHGGQGRREVAGLAQVVAVKVQSMGQAQFLIDIQESLDDLAGGDAVVDYRIVQPPDIAVPPPVGPSPGFTTLRP